MEIKGGMSMKQLSRQAFITFFFIAMVIFMLAGYFYIYRRKVPAVTSRYQYEVVLNDAELKAKNLGVVNAQKSPIAYQKQTIMLHKKEKLCGFSIDQPITLEKIMQLKGPNQQDKVGKQDANSVAYELVVVGDLVRQTNLQTKKSEVIVVNARVSSVRIPLVLDKQTATIANSDNTKTKTISLDELNQSLDDVEKRKNLIAW